MFLKNIFSSLKNIIIFLINFIHMQYIHVMIVHHDCLYISHWFLTCTHWIYSCMFFLMILHWWLSWKICNMSSCMYEKFFYEHIEIKTNMYIFHDHQALIISPLPVKPERTVVSIAVSHSIITFHFPDYFSIVWWNDLKLAVLVVL